MSPRNRCELDRHSTDGDVHIAGPGIEVPPAKFSGELLNNKVRNKLELEKLVGKIPVLAELPKLGRKEKTLVKSSDRSVLAESLRILRTNLDCLMSLRNGKNLENQEVVVHFMTTL